MLLLMIDDRCSPNLVWVDGICCRSDGHWRRGHDLSCVSCFGLTMIYLLTVAGLICQAMIQMKEASVFLT